MTGEGRGTHVNEVAPDLGIGRDARKPCRPQHLDKGGALVTLSYSDEMMLPIVSCSQEALPIVITRASLVVAGVVSIIDPETRVPPSTAMVPVDRVLQVRVFDAEVEDDEWQDRRRGLPDQLLQPHHAEGIISFAKVLEDECSTGGTIIVHCGHGQSRSTAVTAIVAAAWGASAEEAITASRAAHRASFTWDSARAWLPNRRILRVGSEAIYGDARLVATAIAASVGE